MAESLMCVACASVRTDVRACVRVRVRVRVCMYVYVWEYKYDLRIKVRADLFRVF